MIVVMGNNGDGDGEIERNDVKRPVKADGPLNKEDRGSKGEKDQGLNVGLKFQHMAKGMCFGQDNGIFLEYIAEN
jgi:hypothetical protein